jgi:hypothetical protein
MGYSYGQGRKEHLHAINTKKTNGICDILHRKCLLKHVIERKNRGSEEKEEDANGYWMTLGQCTGIRNTKH